MKMTMADRAGTLETLLERNECLSVGPLAMRQLARKVRAEGWTAEQLLDGLLYGIGLTEEAMFEVAP
jgi:hypothetical protein